MSRRVCYGLAIAGVFAALSWLRADLFWQAWDVSLRQLAAGGAGRWRVLGEIVLLSGILAMTWRVLLWRMEPRRDALVAVLALAAGWSVEAWGTRSGLWAYYTGEEPPLWIVPAWPLGALVVGRLAELGQGLWERAAGRAISKRGYWLLAGAGLAIMFVMLRPVLIQAQGAVMLLLMAAVLAYRPDHGRDAWVLAAGFASVFFADVWGTTNNCWRYYVQDGGSLGLLSGVSFGMAFDTVVVLGCLKAARGLSSGPGKILNKLSFRP